MEGDVPDRGSKELDDRLPVDVYYVGEVREEEGEEEGGELAHEEVTEVLGHGQAGAQARLVNQPSN